MMHKQTPSYHTNNKRQSGLGLIEVLIAVVVLSIGFLAAAKMQVEGMRYSQNAYFLSQANLMMRDITDRMRANRDGVIAGHYQNFVTGGGNVEPPCVANSNKCSPQESAAADLYSWNSYLHAPAGAQNFKPLLPLNDDIPPLGRIDYNAATNVHTVSVRWAEQVGQGVEARVLSVQITP